jgi:hypothetical protein
MDNRNHGSADQWPTQQLWPMADSDGSGGQGGGPPSPGGPAAPTPPGRDPRRIGRGTRWAAGLAAVAVLAGGGVALASAGGPARPAAAATGQAATLNTVLSSADSPTLADAAAASPTPAAGTAKRGAACAKAAAQLKAAHRKTAARRVRAACRGRLARLRLMVRGIHGQFTFQTKKGAKTLAFERGTVQSVTATTVTVRASDATTWTWHLVSNTVVRQVGGQQAGGGRSSKKVGASSLADGQRVFVGGPVVGGADNARLIVIRPATSATTPTT